MAIHRTTLQWLNFIGAPGFTNLHWDGTGSTAVADADTKAFASSLQQRLPDGVIVQATGEVETIDEATGELVSVTSYAQGTAVTGSQGGPYSSAVGAVLSWSTAGIVAGRRVRGRTFIVPMSASQFDSSGTLSSGAQSALVASGQGLLSSLGVFGIWSRPRGGLAGSFHEATNVAVPDMTAVLRSRRD